MVCPAADGEERLGRSLDSGKPVNPRGVGIGKDPDCGLAINIAGCRTSPHVRALGRGHCRWPCCGHHRAGEITRPEVLSLRPELK